MAKEARQQKSETLTIRLDPKSRFILEFMSRARGQTITTVVERAIVEAASNVSLDDGYTKWQDIWNVSEASRAIKMASHIELYPTYEDEQLVAFAKHHHDFFYSDKEEKNLRTGMIDIIWPRIKEYIDYWNKNKSTDYFGAGTKMAEAVRSAGVQPPEWPPGSRPARNETKKPPGGRMSNLEDDDIPF